MFTLLTQVVISLMAAAGAILLTTWKASPVPLPLPTEPQRRWLRSAPLLATAAIIGILSTWFTDCLYLKLLTFTVLASVLLCIALMVLHHHLLSRLPGTSTVFVILCFGWSISGTLAVSSLGTLLIAKHQMDALHSAHPLTLWHLVGDTKRALKGPIYLTANLPVQLQAEIQECHDINVEWTLFPNMGSLKNGTYVAPQKIEQQQQITINALSRWYHDVQSATIILLPDSPEITRQQYKGEDQKKRQAIFDMIVISNNHSWVFGSDVSIESNRLGPGGRAAVKPSIPVCKPIMTLAGSHAFDPYVDVIAIGTASREGPHIEEENRADRRSKRIAEWVNLALSNTEHPKQIYAMNLGQYRPQTGDQRKLTKDETAPERPVVLIGVVRNGPLDLQEALRDVLSRNQDNEFFRFLAVHYPRRDISDYHQLPKSECD